MVDVSEYDAEVIDADVDVIKTISWFHGFMVTERLYIGQRPP